jgi:hypothetical protein
VCVVLLPVFTSNHSASIRLTAIVHWLLYILCYSVSNLIYPQNLDTILFPHHNVQIVCGAHPVSVRFVSLTPEWPNVMPLTMLTRHFHPVLRSRIQGAWPPCPHIPSWLSTLPKEKIYLCLFYHMLKSVNYHVCTADHIHPLVHLSPCDWSQMLDLYQFQRYFASIELCVAFNQTKSNV